VRKLLFMEVNEESQELRRPKSYKRALAILFILAVLLLCILIVGGQKMYRNADKNVQEIAALKDQITRLETAARQRESEVQSLLNAQPQNNNQEQLDKLIENQNGLLKQITVLERRTQEPAAQAAPIKLETASPATNKDPQLQNLIDDFPRTALLAAIAAQEKRAAQEPGWLHKALSRYIKVRDDNFVDPVGAVNAAHQAAIDGDITGALELIAALNPPVRAQAEDWTRRAKKTVKASKE